MIPVSDSSLALLFALGATCSFATSSLVYAEYSKRVSVLWMNCFKAVVAFIALAITIPIFSGWHTPSPASVLSFMLSGFLGLNIGDLFLLAAFTRLGAARTLILFGFQPLFMGVGAFLLFGQPLDAWRFVAVIFMVLCLFTFSLERYRSEKSWELTGLFFALAGVCLDSCGVLLTRAAFNESPQLAAIEGHFYRCLGALLGFAIISRFRPFAFTGVLEAMSRRGRTLVIAASLGGTYLSLLLYLSAVKIGHLASISAIAITGPMFATLLESLVHRKAPSAYLYVAFLFFGIGFYILVLAS